MSVDFEPEPVTTGIVNSGAIKNNFDSLATLLSDVEVTSTSDFGITDVTPDGDGNATISHALGQSPDYAAVNLIGDQTDSVDVQSTSSSDITVRVRDADGADVTSGTHSVSWLVKATTI